jgi:aquaporin Z
MAYAIGLVSGCHLNPAVSIGLAVARRFKVSELRSTSRLKLSRRAALRDRERQTWFRCDLWPRIELGPCLLAEVVLTLMFLMIIPGATGGAAPQVFALIATGLVLTVVHLTGIPVTKVSLNPARSTGPAIFVGGWAISQLWMFWFRSAERCWLVWLIRHSQVIRKLGLLRFRLRPRLPVGNRPYISRRS